MQYCVPVQHLHKCSSKDEKQDKVSAREIEEDEIGKRKVQILTIHYVPG